MIAAASSSCVVGYPRNAVVTPDGVRGYKDGAMPLLLLTLIAALAGIAVFAASMAIQRRHPVPMGLHAARDVGEKVGHRARVRSVVVRRLNPDAATGLALTVALALIVVGGLVLAVLAYLIRANDTSPTSTGASPSGVIGTRPRSPRTPSSSSRLSARRGRGRRADRRRDGGDDSRSDEVGDPVPLDRRRREQPADPHREGPCRPGATGPESRSRRRSAPRSRVVTHRPRQRSSSRPPW